MDFQPRGDNFKLTIGAQELARGMRPSKRMPRNSGYLIQSSGAVGRDGVLQVLDPLPSLDLSIITDGFPYPQIFVFVKLIIVCGKTDIYELVHGTLQLKLTVSAGYTWEALDFRDFIYMSNGKVSVERDPASALYSLSEQPIAGAMENYNGQVIIGSSEFLV